MRVDFTSTTHVLFSRSFSPGAVIPDSINKMVSSTSSEILHVTADNVDIQLDTLDGKKGFHSTQMVAFVRGA